jgi:Ca2+-binding EF-hand superfamily protein
MNNLEVHLREIFAKYDDKKMGKIKVEHFEEALKKS